jgi:hypothetical protein
MSEHAPFAETFWEHLTPRLTRLCVAQARCVAAGVESFSGAWDAIMRYARNYGALHLPDHQLHELEEFITINLSAAVFEAETADEWSNWLKNNHIQGGRTP